MIETQVNHDLWYFMALSGLSSDYGLVNISISQGIHKSLRCISTIFFFDGFSTDSVRSFCDIFEFYGCLLLGN